MFLFCFQINTRNGYKIKKISVDRFGEQEVPVTNNKYVMPSYNVFVNVEFELDIVNPRTSDNILSILFFVNTSNARIFILKRIYLNVFKKEYI